MKTFPWLVVILQGEQLIVTTFNFHLLFCVHCAPHVIILNYYKLLLLLCSLCHHFLAITNHCLLFCLIFSFSLWFLCCCLQLSPPNSCFWVMHDPFDPTTFFFVLAIFGWCTMCLFFSFYLNWCCNAKVQRQTLYWNNL
jgi:hypothetical protein